MGTGEKGRYPGHAHARGLTSFSLAFTCNGASDPVATNTVDPGFVVKSIVRASEGTITITLKRRYAKLIPSRPNLLSTDLKDAKVSAWVDGVAADNTITVTTFDAGDSAADDQTAQVTLHLHAYDSAGSQG